MIIDINQKQLTLVVGSKHLEKTKFMADILKEATEKDITTLFIRNNYYIERICEVVRNRNVKLLLIDDILCIKTKEEYILGTGDIISIIIKQLKQLSDELDIAILATAPADENIIIDDVRFNKERVISFFCKAKMAQDYIDDIFLIQKEIKV